MKRILTVFLLVALSTSSCAWWNKPHSPVVQGAIDCTEEATRKVAIDLLPAVSSALATGEYAALLGGLVAKWGFAAVACAVQKITSESELNIVHARADATAELKAKNGRAWLNQNPASFK